MRFLLPRRQRRGDSRERSRGQSMVEFALVLPLLLFLFAGAADLGRLFYNYVALENAVKEGAIYGARNPLCNDASDLCRDPNNVRWRVENEARTAGGGAVVSLDTLPTCLAAAGKAPRGDLDQCAAGDTYVVGATVTFTPITPILGQIIGGSITLASTSRAIVLNEAFDPTPGLAPTKLILGSAARNAAVLAANCEQPDPVGSPGYYRSPCVDIVNPIDPVNPTVAATFRPGDTIFYRITVLNNGGTNITGVTMADSLGWPSCPVRPTTMNVGTAYTCAYSRLAPAVGGGGDSSTYTDTLTVDGTEVDPTADAAAVTIEKPPADLRVLTSVSPYKLGGSGAGPAFGTANTISMFYNAQNPSPTVWYKVVVTNDGGRTATGLTITDTNGALPVNADCPARPSSLAGGASWICLYSRSFSSTATNGNTVTATSPDAAPDGNDAQTATVTVAQCTGTNRAVPNLIGVVKATAVTKWKAGSGFSTNLTTWSGLTTSVVATQNRVAATCVASNVSMTVTS